MHRTRVGVLRGGVSGEYDVSLQTGGTVLKNLPEKYQPIDILISKNGTWHRGGVPMTLYQALKDIDVVFNALHGEYGEDGKLQRDLESISIPYTGSKSLASAIGMNKILSKNIFAEAGIKTPISRTLTKDTDDTELFEIFHELAGPVIVKPASGGSSLGISIVATFEEVASALKKALEYSPEVIIEEYIKGREATCGVIDNFRGKETYALLPVEIVPKNSFFDYEAKYQDACSYFCPAKSFSHEEKEEMERVASKVHNVLGLRHYSRTDFIVSPRGIYALEVNTLPGLTSHSLVPMSLAAAGITLPQFFDHILTLALTGH